MYLDKKGGNGSLCYIIVMERLLDEIKIIQ